MNHKPKENHQKWLPMQDLGDEGCRLTIKYPCRRGSEPIDSHLHSCFATICVLTCVITASVIAMRIFLTRLVHVVVFHYLLCCEQYGYHTDNCYCFFPHKTAVICLLHHSYIIRLAVPFYFPEGNLFDGHAGRERCGINHIMKQQ